MKKSVDYPDYAKKVSNRVSKRKSDIGILVCGSGTGMAMSANKIKGIRAAVCYNLRSTRLSRQHNDANILVLGSRLISEEEAIKCLLMFFNTNFEGDRHQARLDKFNDVKI